MSLRARILWLVLVASLLPVLAMVWVLLENRAATLEQVRGQLTARTGVIASDLDDKISGTAQLLFGLARVPLLGLPDTEACSVFLAEVLREHPQYTGLLTIRPDGHLHCDSLRSGRQLDLNDRSYFMRALTATRHVVEPVIGRLTGKAVLQIAYPVRDAQGALRFVMLASLNLDDYGRSVAASLPYRQMNLQIWNDDASLVLDYPGSGAARLAVDAVTKRFVLSEAMGPLAETLGEAAQARIWASALLPRTRDAGLRLVLSVPEVDLHAQVDVHFRRALAGVLLTSVLVFLGAAGLGEFAVRRQAARLMVGISRLDAGRFDEPIGAPYPRGELGEVMVALDRMADSLSLQREVIHHNTEALKRQASHDALTGLANRHLLTDRLTQALIYARRSHRVTGVLVLDLDRFKTVNDSLGHSHGDLLLQTVAERLSGCVRQGDTVARLGGDEFVLVLSDMAEVSDIVPVAQKILSTLAQRVRVGGQDLSVSTSLGISVFPRDADTADVLLQHADTAMYRAKARGGNAMAFFTPEMNEETVERLRVEAGLRRALEQGELRLHFQPIVDAVSGRIVSAEALVRWQDPEFGLVSPARFIPIAEETGLIVPLGDWVMRTACTHAQAWQAAGLGDVPVAVNLSARQFSHPALDASIAAALAATACPAALLQLEITESMVMAQPDHALVTMQRLKAMGVQLSIDDFGTGYSSLSHLKRFPVHKLKIDRSFVQDIETDPNDAAIVDAILVLAKKLGLRTVAEGVETEGQVAFLAALGCDEYQGYLFGRPCTPEQFEQRVRSAVR
ncbi:EAL domain-containing protein [Sphaerotilus sp.]|uniref:bifunctional diguanylate cyclase/phosphodiesterase n=1 Tax=Sphaerotilus sp. TaxID=2093942 RepID=UPI00286EAD04|nr:EAL domain-containing protein [Sphaerotilus sp.]